jgi:hypothetical protein
MPAMREMGLGAIDAPANLKKSGGAIYGGAITPA